MRGSHYYTYANDEISVNESNTRASHVGDSVLMVTVTVMVRSARFSLDRQKERKYALSDGNASSCIHSFPEFWVKFSCVRKVAARLRQVDGPLPQASPKAKVDASRSGD